MASRLLSGNVRVCHPRGCLIDLLHRRADAIGRFKMPPTRWRSSQPG